MVKEGAIAHEINAIIDNTITIAINLFLSTKSPNGTIKRISKIFYPPKESELMVEMLLDCIIFLTVTYIPTYIG